MAEWREQTVGEEIANSVTHGVGAVLALVGGGALLVGGIRSGGSGGYAAAGFASSLASVYLSSTLYHALAFTGYKRALQTIDRVCIHFFLAGSLTPLALHAADPGHSAPVIWGMAGLGAAFEARFGLRYQVLSSWVYGLWLAFGLVMSSGGFYALDWAPIGGFLGGLVCYAIGFVFFWSTKLRFHHAIWHVFVLLGSAVHFCTVWSLC
jgi:hemolysin III